jgi:replicative DNA helicase
MAAETTTKPEFVVDAVNEILVLSAAKSDTDPKLRKRLVHQLSSDQFFVPMHGIIWRALREIADRALVLSPDVARQFILANGGDSEAADYFDSLASDVSENLDFHIETLQWDATRAGVIKGAVPKIIQALQDPKATQDEVMTAARSLARSLEGGARRYMARPAETYNDYLAEIAARRIKRNLFPLGAAPFDKNLTEGFMPGRTTVTAGLSGAGKSTVWIAFAIMLAKLGRRVLWCCWEMDKKSVLDVAVTHMTRLNLRDVVQGKLSDEDTKRVAQATKWLVQHISFMDNPFIGSDESKKPSNARNLDVLEGYLSESGCHVAIYDLWERMLAWTKPDDVTKALYRMQHIHKEYGLHGVIVQQLRLKDVENRADKRPTREAIKGVGSFVEVADLIFGIHREGQFKNVEDCFSETICLKQRKGVANWSIRWNWDGAKCGVYSPIEVPYDPGLENAAEIGDIGGVKASPDSKIGRRNQ